MHNVLHQRCNPKIFLYNYTCIHSLDDTVCNLTRKHSALEHLTWQLVKNKLRMICVKLSSAPLAGLVGKWLGGRVDGWIG